MVDVLNNRSAVQDFKDFQALLEEMGRKSKEDASKKKWAWFRPLTGTNPSVVFWSMLAAAPAVTLVEAWLVKSTLVMLHLW